MMEEILKLRSVVKENETVIMKQNQELELLEEEKEKIENRIKLLVKKLEEVKEDNNNI
jgi:phenolic acid decarboxylase